MKNSNKLTIFSLITVGCLLAFQNCTPQSVSATDTSQQVSSEISSRPTGGVEVQVESDSSVSLTAAIPTPAPRQLLAVRFIKNAGFRVEQNLNQDIQIIKNRDGSFQASSTHSDSECFKVSRKISSYEQQLMTEALGYLKVKNIQRPEDDPIMIDGGFARLEIVWLNGKSQTVELFENNGLLNYQLAENGEDIAKIFNFIDSNFAVACQ